MKNILDKLEKKHPNGKYGVIIALGICEVTYHNYKSKRRVLPPHRAKTLIELAKSFGIKTSYDEIYGVLNAS